MVSHLECFPDTANNANVVPDQLGHQVEVVLGLLLMHLLHLLLHLGQLGEGRGQLAVVLGAAKHGEALGEGVRVAGEGLPVLHHRLSRHVQLPQLIKGVFRKYQD